MAKFELVGHGLGNVDVACRGVIVKGRHRDLLS